MKTTLLITHPNICEQWGSQNIINPSEVTAGSNKRIWWKCPIAKDHVWQTAIADRIRYNINCPFCYGRYASSTNNLLLLYPNICQEWDYVLNSIKPIEITPGSVRKVYWRCKNNKDHSWMATPNNRTSLNQQCPYCSGKKPDTDTSLLSKFPELCKEWDVTNEITPNNVLPSSHKKVQWICKNNSSHKWVAKINNRTSCRKSDCPYCNGSKGELAIRLYLNQLKISFSEQYKIPDCKHKKSLPFDFALHSQKLKLIEFQGEQHYKCVNYFGGGKSYKLQELRDKIKADYCKDRKIPLLIIKYNEVENIPNSINYFLSV